MSPVLFVFVLHVSPKYLIHHRNLKKGILEGGKNGKKEGREIDGGDNERKGRKMGSEREGEREGREEEATEAI